jgi:hypothetical protein
MALQIGTRLLLNDQGDGWFRLAPADGLHVRVEAMIAATSSDEPFYAFRFENQLEVQEDSNQTASKLISVFYERGVIKSRWQGIDIGAEPAVSVYMLLVQAGNPMPISYQECLGLSSRIWASCTLVA